MVFFRCCVGMGMGSMPVTYTLLTECLPTKNRGIYLTVVHAFWVRCLGSNLSHVPGAVSLHVCSLAMGAA